MDVNDLLQTALTPLEKILKRCFQLRPVFREYIPNTDELMEYIQWMIQEFGDNPEYRPSPDDVLDPAFNLSNNRLALFGGQLLNDPHNAKALHSITDSLSLYQEDNFFSADQDISVGRMLRYMPSHWHSKDHFEVFYSFSGECPVHFTTETIMMKPGTVLIIAPNVVYATPCFNDDCVSVFYMLRASTFDRVFWNQIPPENLMARFFRRALDNQQSNAYLHFETGNDPEIRRLGSRIYAEFLQDRSYRSQLMNALMREFFILLLQGYEGTARLPRNDDFYWKHEYSAILSYIQAHFTSIKLPDLVEQFHYSEKQIRRIVQYSTGMGFAQLITKLRMERAATLLQRGNFPVEKISSVTGYANASSFYRVFSQYYGCTPGKYLEQCKNGSK